MVLEAEILSLNRVGSLVCAEGWRNELRKARRSLGRWLPSADAFALWVSDYGKLRRFLDELNAQIEHLAWMLGSEPTRDSVEQNGIHRAIDRAVRRIGELADTIDAELRDSAVACAPSADPCRV
jgi:hypothetical protein